MKKRIIIEVGHPNDVHQFKYLYRELYERNWTVLFLAKKKDIVVQLLEAYDLPFKIFGTTPHGVWRKMLSLFWFDVKYFVIAKEFRPSIILSRNSPHSAHYAWLTRTPHLGFADTEHSGFADKLALPFMQYFFTSTSFEKEFPRYHFRYPGYIETWYLHPRRFQPNPKVLQLLDIRPGERFCILRFVSWQAHHDVGLKGLSDAHKIQLVEALRQYGRVFISSELPLPSALETYKFQLPPEYMHDALFYASLFYGESATMSSECAMLGTPAIFLYNKGLGYTNEQEKTYGLINRYCLDESSIAESISKALQIMENDRKADKAHAQNQKLLKDIVDPNLLFIWVLENFPKSIETLSQDSGIIRAFK